MMKNTEDRKKSTQLRVAFALMCGLAICCSVMYITADGEESIHYSDVEAFVTRSKMHVGQTYAFDALKVNGAQDMEDWQRVQSFDVKKTGKIYTQTPDGAEYLADYFKKLEAKIAEEVAARKYDINTLRTKMAKNMALNAAARKKMKTALQKQMAINAKSAKDALEKKMAQVAVKFAEVAKEENKRYQKNLARSKFTREVMRKNKRSNAKELRIAVLTQQRAMTALAEETSKALRKTQKHISANSEAIAENARIARRDLDDSMNRFNKNMLLISNEAKAGRNELSRRAADMDKKLRAKVDGQIKMQVERAKVEFQNVETEMAKDRKHADESLAQASSRLTASLAAQKALNERRFASTVRDIAAAKKEASDRLKKAKAEFKTKIYALSTTAKHQMATLKNRMSVLTGKVEENRATQQRLNGKVRNEIDHMVNVGKERESKLAKKNAELKAVMKKNKEAAAREMKQMANSFTTKLNEIQAQMKKNRAYQEKKLGHATTHLYASLKANIQAQAAINKQLNQATRRAKMDAHNALLEAKSHFASKLGGLSQVVAKNERKVNSQVDKLEGQVHVNAQKDAAARDLLAVQQKANKEQLKNAIGDAVAKGEARAQQIEKMAKKMNAKTRVKLNARISTEISHLTKQIHHGIEDLQLSTAESRKRMERQVRESLVSEAVVLKAQLKDTVKWANKRFVELEDASSKNPKLDVTKAKTRAKKAIVYAVLAQTRGLVALKQELNSKIPKAAANDLGAYGDLMVKNVDSVVNQMEDNLNSLIQKVNQAKTETAVQLSSNEVLAKTHEAALTSVEKALKNAKAAVKAKFGVVYANLGKARAADDERLAQAVIRFNDALAKNAALQSASFSTTVKDLAAAKKKANTEVIAARKAFTMALASVRATITAAERRKVGEMQEVGKMLIPVSTQKARVDSRVKAEILHVIALANAHQSSAKRARGPVKELFDKTKALAAQQVKDLRKSTMLKLDKEEYSLDPILAQSKTDLEAASKDLFLRMAAAQLKSTESMSKIGAGMVKVSEEAGLADSKKDFAAKLLTFVDVFTFLHKMFAAKMRTITGVPFRWSQDEAANGLVAEMANMMVTIMNSKIVSTIQTGETKAKIDLDRTTEHMLDARKALLAEVAEELEEFVDETMASVPAQRANIANNYLTLKGYCGASSDRIINYVQSSKGFRSLMSIGDFLQTVAIASKSKTPAAYGVAAGLATLEPAFGGSPIKMDAGKTKTDGLVNEFTALLTEVQMRWGMGLGKYLLGKLEQAMEGSGIVVIGKKRDVPGQFAMIGGHKLGLTNRLSALETIAAPIVQFQSYLGKLTKKLPKNIQHPTFTVPPPEWQGN